MPKLFFLHMVVVFSVLIFSELAGPYAFATGPQAPLILTLPEAINLSLRHNRTVKSVYLSRIVDKFDLKVEYNKFKPDLTLTSSAILSGTKTDYDKIIDDDDDTDSAINNTLALDKFFSSGATFSFSWARDDTYSKTNDSDSDWRSTNTWQISIIQPLLKGFGRKINMASLTLADISEQKSLLGLQDTIISTVNATISAFRTYAKATRQLEISRASVERSRNSLENDRLMVSMGRLAANELIQTESDLANQELSYESAVNRMDSARLSLLEVLDMDTELQITPILETDMTPVHPDFNRCLETAFANRSDYIAARLDVKSAQINLMLAKDNMKWQLNAITGYTVTDVDADSSSDSQSGAWEVGVDLSVPLYGDLTRNQALLSAQTTLETSQLNFKETKQSIVLDVKNAIREVETSLKQVGMAVRARELSEKKLTVEKEKLAVGRSTTFQVLTYQNDLVSSQESELDAKIAYLDALKALDTCLGTTLDTWKIDYNKENDKWPGK